MDTTFFYWSVYYSVFILSYFLFVVFGGCYFSREHEDEIRFYLIIRDLNKRKSFVEFFVSFKYIVTKKVPKLVVSHFLGRSDFFSVMSIESDDGTFSKIRSRPFLLGSVSNPLTPHSSGSTLTPLWVYSS